MTNKDSSQLHCTKLLLQNYRKIKAAISRAEKKNNKRYDNPFADDFKTDARSESIQISKWMIQELETAIMDLEDVSKNGEILSQIIKICYINGGDYIPTETIMEMLLDRRICLTRRNFFYYKKQAIEELSFLLWFGMTDQMIKALKDAIHYYEE